MHTHSEIHTVSIDYTYTYVCGCVSFGEILLQNIFINSKGTLNSVCFVVLFCYQQQQQQQQLIVWPQNGRRKECKDTGNSSMEKSINMHAAVHTGTLTPTHSPTCICMYIEISL